MKKKSKCPSLAPVHAATSPAPVCISVV